MKNNIISKELLKLARIIISEPLDMKTLTKDEAKRAISMFQKINNELKESFDSVFKHKTTTPAFLEIYMDYSKAQTHIANIVNYFEKTSKETEVVEEKPSVPDFEKALNEFIDYCQKIINDQYKKSYPNLTVPKLVSEKGSRYVRIVKGDGGGRSAFAFIDKTNGNILKPASWKTPAKHARGNIFSEDWKKTVGPYGPAYLR